MAASDFCFPDIGDYAAGLGDDLDLAFGDVGRSFGSSGGDFGGASASEENELRSDSLERTIFRLQQSTFFNSETNAACCEVLNHRRLLLSSIGELVYDTMQGVPEV
jgi:hypothetical protein